MSTSRAMTTPAVVDLEGEETTAATGLVTNAFSFVFFELFLHFVSFFNQKSKLSKDA